MNEKEPVSHDTGFLYVNYTINLPAFLASDLGPINVFQTRSVMQVSAEEIERRRKIMERARALIASPLDWSRVWHAQAIDERQVNIQDPAAICFSAVGALRRAAYEVGVRPDSHALTLALGLPSTNDLQMTNEGRGHAAVIEVFDNWFARHPAQS